MDPVARGEGGTQSVLVDPPPDVLSEPEEDVAVEADSFGVAAGVDAGVESGEDEDDDDELSSADLDPELSPSDEDVEPEESLTAVFGLPPFRLSVL